MAGLREGTNVQYWTGSFSGFRASRNAFDQPFEARVTLIFPDYSYMGGVGDSAWEIDILPERSGLVWFMETENAYQSTASACVWIVNTDRDDVEPVLRCLRRDYCPKLD